MVELILDILLPHNACALCRKPGVYWSRKPWCEECDTRMQESREPLETCRRCGKYLCSGGVLCTECEEKDPPFFIARAVGPYENGFKIAVKILKFLCRRYIGVRMGVMMGKVVANEPQFWPLDLVVPVPISEANLKQRGFNQGEVLARQVARTIKVKMDAHVLVRVKETPSQRELSKQEREANLKNAFQVQHGQKIRGKNILLVDDVYTTGSTVKECVQVLLDAGANRVAVITWATGKGY
ncbi:MAG: ComF family protein [Syntrophomonadaceae bacterium]|nr:ComF family protein [Syntrophomonadaceae bacterium]